MKKPRRKKMSFMCISFHLCFFLLFVFSVISPHMLVREALIVDQNGGGNFKTIGEAVAAAPNSTNVDGGYFLIRVKGGVYKEYIVVPYNKKNLMMVGEGINKTIIEGNHCAKDFNGDTMKSSTFDVSGEHFVAINITFRNTAGAAKYQAVAVLNRANLSTFFSCSFESYQDTLLTHDGMQFYRNCDIYGTIDFIFGDATAVLQNCNIYVRLPLQGQSNAIVAQARAVPEENTGIVIHNCTITAAPDLATGSRSTKTYLGRPWGKFSRTIYMQSFKDGLVDPSGWLPWDNSTNTSSVYLGEYSNRGPGSAINKRVKWPGYHNLSRGDAKKFTVSNFISGDSWLHLTGVPFDGGLL